MAKDETLMGVKAYKKKRSNRNAKRINTQATHSVYDLYRKGVMMTSKQAADQKSRELKRLSARKP